MKRRKIEIDHLFMLRSKGIVQVQFRQKYQSSHTIDKGLKTLYLTKNEDSQYQIISEIWEPLKFTPSISFQQAILSTIGSL